MTVKTDELVALNNDMITIVDFKTVDGTFKIFNKISKCQL